MKDNSIRTKVTERQRMTKERQKDKRTDKQNEDLLEVVGHSPVRFEGQEHQNESDGEIEE